MTSVPAADPLPVVLCGTRGSLCGVRLPAGIASRVIRRTDCPFESHACACNPVIAVIDGSEAATRLQQTLSEQKACIEDEPSCVLVGANLNQTLAAHGLYLTLTTRTAYHTEPARQFCAALAERLSLDDERRQDMELALHEAVVNGLLHGNLEISSAGRDTLDGLNLFCDTVAERLKDPQLANRPLEIFAVWDQHSIHLSVLDGGPGYDPDSLPSPDDPNRKSGRGLFMIRQIANAITISEHGRCMTMRFDR